MPNRYFEEFEVGQRLTTRGRTVTETDIVNFAGVSSDFFPLHMDQEYAARTRFGQRIAHGFLVLSMASGMVPADPERVEGLYGLDRVRFIKPVFIGDTIHVEMEVLSLQERSDASGVVEFKQSIINQRGELVIVNSYRLLMRKRPSEKGA
ncbi:MAG: MaoC/PaaZ C-terminal domain-containing protein [Anaerolineae bacterium]